MRRISITKPRRNWKGHLLAVLAVFGTAFSAFGKKDSWNPAADIVVPEPMREFRGVWVTTVYNLDWPSKPGLPAEVQKLELREIFDRVEKLNLNAVVLQVRTMCDAFYDSPIEPWSYYLTGELGKPPAPFYDPLKYAVEEAHARGLELHAWFNPFRATTASYGEIIPKNHISKQYPWLLRKIGYHSWLDPSSDFTRNRALTTVFDVVNRYDIDGVHIDDYFYPYPRKNGPPGLDDLENWQRLYLTEGIEDTDDNRADWRREIVNTFIQDLYDQVKRAKSWVKVGISPFGIWRPKHPAGIDGLDAWRLIYADSRKWIREGWADYFSPQLYWKRGGKQDFNKLYSWWQDQNVKGRHLWPGIASSRIGRRGAGEADGRDAMEILEQISHTRTDLGKAPASGQLHWRWEAFATNRGGLSRLITMKRYAEKAIPPPTPWLADPEKPTELPRAEDLGLDEVETGKYGKKDGELKEDRWELSWIPGEGDTAAVRWWLVQTRSQPEDDGGDVEPVWTTHRLIPGKRLSFSFEAEEVEKMDAISVRAVGRVGELGPLAVLERG